MPVVGQREPCPCGSGKRYKACHGRAAGEERRIVTRPFAGRVDETEWVALREIVPAATASLTLKDAPDREVTVSTVLPLAWPALVRADGRVFLGLQVQARSGDVSRDLGHALELALEAAPGGSVIPTGLPGAGARLQDLLTDDPIQVTVHEGFDYWVEGAPDPTGDVAASMERANASVIPTVRLESVMSAYWCRMRAKTHLRWVLPHDEEPLLDAMARLASADALGIGPDSRYVGSFRAHGLLVPVWDLPGDREADALEQPVGALQERLDAELASPRPLTSDERRARSGLLSRQLTLR
ncbi:MAG: topoisomerase [Frankiales bacterium]|nr:topoisomerase [Frankiales bacterium]